MQRTTNAERWDAGCETDEVRNDFIIPQLVRLFDEERPKTILDVGSATGYVSRKVDERLSYSPEWTILDADADRIALAEKRKPSSMNQESLVCDVMTLPPTKGPYDAALVAFTLLEVTDIECCVRRVRQAMNEHATLVVVLPDAWGDVLRHTTEVVSNFVVGPVNIPKVDKFTGQSYPFRAVRIEETIGAILRCGFQLFELTRSAIGGGTFLLAFRRIATVRDA